MGKKSSKTAKKLKWHLMCVLVFKFTLFHCKMLNYVKNKDKNGISALFEPKFNKKIPQNHPKSVKNI